MVETLVGRIQYLANCFPDKLAVAFKSDRLTYRELYEKAETIAGSLCRQGIQPGDRVCFSAVSKPEMIAIYLAVQMIGAVSVFLDKNGTLENMVMIYRESGAKLLLTDKPMKEYACQCNVVKIKDIYSSSVSAEPVEIYEAAEDELSEILFTTGTTGNPKGVMLTYKSVYHIFMNTIEGIHITENEIMLLPLPLNHSFALRVLRAVLYQGATVILQNGFTFAKSTEENINAFSCTAMACVPASYEVMRSQMQDAFRGILSKLRFIEFSAGSLSIRQRREISKLLPDVQIYNTWGSSESGGAIFCNVTACVKESEMDEKNPVIGSLGRPLAGKVEVNILSPEAPVNEPARLASNLEQYIIESSPTNAGRMMIKGDMQMAGYWKNADATAQTLVDGWLLTGDMAYLDGDGNVYMLGRADDIINVGGEKVSPIEVENIAGQYEQVRECACIGAEDPEGITGQIPVLFVVAKQGYKEEDLIRFISSKAERYKLPQRFVKLQELPRNRMQKIDRKQLKELWCRMQDGSSMELMNPVVESILSRRSIRKFTDQEIPPEVLNMILKCGYYAPSGHNMQTWRFTVLSKQPDIQRLRQVTEITAKEKNVHFYGWENPKVIILVSNDDRNADGCQDASCAAENIMLAAQSYGIGSVWLNPLMTLRKIEPVRAVLDDMGIPEDHTVWAAIALGYPVSEGALLQKKENVIHFV